MKDEASLKKLIIKLLFLFLKSKVDNPDISRVIISFQKHYSLKFNLLYLKKPISCYIIILWSTITKRADCWVDLPTVYCLSNAASVNHSK